MADADVPRFWQELGLPGLVDIHVHFMPEPVMQAVWRYFDAALDRFGVDTPIRYRLPASDRVAILERLGVRAFPALLYPHRPGMAEGLNSWARQFAASTPGCVATGTFFAEPSAPRYVREALEAGTRVFKAHLQVGGYDPRDAVLDAVWGMLADAGVPVVVHCGSGPVPGAYTGPGPFGDVLAAHPRLTAVIAHCGAPEYAEHLALAETFPNLHLDTTMVGTPYLERLAPMPPDLIPRLGQLQDRIVLGSDFPNIPYDYAEQLDALRNYDLGPDWLRSVCWQNGARLLQV